MADETPDSTAVVIVLAFEGSEDRMRALWEKNFRSGLSSGFKIVSVKPGYSVMDVLAGILADTSIEEEFVLVQANTFPTVPKTVTELSLPFVYVNVRGEQVYDNRLPVALKKKDIADYLERIQDEKDFIPEEFFRAMFQDPRPLEASHHFGNVMLQVISASPCSHKVIEGLIRKHYICTSPEGWNGIVSIVDEYLKG